MRKEDLPGKRYINHVRCSTDPQTETSIPDQLEQLNRVGLSYGGVYVDDLILDGVSGSKPGNRSDIDDLIARKRRDNDFDVVLTLMEDRFTRGGATHGAWAEHELVRHGIQVVYVSSDVPDGPYAHIIRMLKYQAAHETVKTTGNRSAGGSQRALVNGNIATPSHTNYGLYRLYVHAEGKPICLIRDLRDGTQQRLDPITRQVLDVYGTVGGGGTGHFRKQKSDKVFLVVGDEMEAWVVRFIMQRRWLEGRGGRLISNELNYVHHKPAPCGGIWTQRQVEVISENPIYCGEGVANWSSSASFFQRANGSPQAVTIDPTILATRKYLPVRLRPPEDWHWKEEPHLNDFLPEPLRSVAMSKIKEIRLRHCDPNRPKRRSNTHINSLYILHPLLTAKQDGRPLKGQTSGTADKPVRYYVHAIAQKDPVAAGFENTTFRADALEPALLQCLAETLSASSDLRGEIRLAVSAVLAADKPPVDEDVVKLKARHEAISKQIHRILTITGDEGIEEATAIVSGLKREQCEINQRINLAKTSHEQPSVNPDALVESLVHRLTQLGDGIQGLPLFPLKQVLAAMTQSMTADMLTREVEMQVRVPAEAVHDVKTAIDQLCLQQTSGSSALSQTQWATAAVLATIRCEHERVSQKQCYRCRRLPKAA